MKTLVNFLKVIIVVIPANILYIWLMYNVSWFADEMAKDPAKFWQGQASFLFTFFLAMIVWREIDESN